MASPTLVTVIISSHNYERYLPQAIDSALAQSYLQVEVIVVDDGSTDRSPDIICSYGSRLRAICKENGGQASALNAGFRESHGELIVFLDSDDLLLPHAVDTIERRFNDGRWSKVHWPMSVVDQFGEYQSKIIKPNLPQGDLSLAVIEGGPHGYHWPPTGGNAFSRSVLESILPIPESDFRVSPDVYLCALAALYGEVGRNPEPLSACREHAYRATSRGSWDARLAENVHRHTRCMEAVADHAERLGLRLPDPSVWQSRCYWRRIAAARSIIESFVPKDSTFILADAEYWVAGLTIAGRSRMPFTECDGMFNGLPEDDAAAIQELERLRRAGCGFLALVWPTLWIVDYYTKFMAYVRERYTCVRESADILLFAL